MTYYLNGVWAIVEEWISRDCAESVEQIELIINNCVCPNNALQNKKYEE